MQESGLVGLFVACVGNILVQAERKRANPYYQLNMGEFVASGAVGYGVGSLAGTLPDLLEPATHPGHRDFCHSLTAGTLVAVGAKKLNDNPKVPQLVKTVGITAAAGYLAHLYADGQTPAGLPLLTKR